MSSRKVKLGIVAGCALAAIGGYLLATMRPATGGEKATELAAAASNRATAGDPDPAGRSAVGGAHSVRSAEQLAALRKDLCGRFEDSPSAEYDWALHGQAAAILATMSAQELQEFAKELSASEPVGASMFREVPAWKRALEGEIFRQWGLKDPAAACLGTIRFYREPDARSQVFDDWLRRDPAAATAWMNAGNFPPGGEKYAGALQQDLLNHQAATDFAAARESLGKLDAEAQKRRLLDWSQKLARDPAKREELLALLASRGDAEFTQKCLQSMVGEMAVQSPYDASVYVESSDLPDEQKHALSEQVLGQWAFQDPPQAFARWAELKDDSEAPKPLLKAMDNWSLNSPGAEEAFEWVNKLDAGPAREQFKGRLIERMSGGGRYPQAAELSASLDDPAERIRQMKIIKRNWQGKGGEEWYRGLPQADRDAME